MFNVEYTFTFFLILILHNGNYDDNYIKHLQMLFYVLVTLKTSLVTSKAVVTLRLRTVMRTNP